MITLINDKKEEHIVVPTIFPDKTSQVWKLPENILKFSDFKIKWDFENEAEFIHICQLVDLLNEQLANSIYLSIPYLPYARQDKEISNNTTFALHTFLKLLKTLTVDTIEVLDPHNKFLVKAANANIHVDDAWRYISNTLEKLQCDLICFPDKGASQRGYYINNKPFFCLEKNRDQLTGEITGLKLENDLFNLKNKSILIIDDICDGGRTFIEAAKLLYNEGVKEVNLYVTHGIFSKGLQVLRDAGIKRIFTYKGEQ